MFAAIGFANTPRNVFTLGRGYLRYAARVFAAIGFANTPRKRRSAERFTLERGYLRYAARVFAAIGFANTPRLCICANRDMAGLARELVQARKT